MTLRLRDGVSVAQVDYGTALLDEEAGQYWNCNPTAAMILHTMLDGGTADEAAQAVVEEYEVDLAAANRDVQALIEALSSAGLVEREDPSSVAVTHEPPRVEKES